MAGIKHNLHEIYFSICCSQQRTTNISPAWIPGFRLELRQKEMALEVYCLGFERGFLLYDVSHGPEKTNLPFRRNAEWFPAQLGSAAVSNASSSRARELPLTGEPGTHCWDRAKVAVKGGREWDGQALLNPVESFKCPKQDGRLFMVSPVRFSEKEPGTEHAISGRQRLQNDANLPALD